jgi:hypothetical protein
VGGDGDGDQGGVQGPRATEGPTGGGCHPAATATDAQPRQARRAAHREGGGDTSAQVRACREGGDRR